MGDSFMIKLKHLEINHECIDITVLDKSKMISSSNSLNNEIRMELNRRANNDQC